MSQVAAPAAKPELRALTSLRGIAAMAVVLQHFAATFQQYWPDLTKCAPV
jgi:peptidoglycan/LPS O-acetylase OafA/YrhL